MSQKLIASMPKDIDLEDGSILRVTAVDAATGAVVSGVKVSNIVITAINTSSTGDLGTPPVDWTLQPIYEMPGSEIP